MNNNRKTIHRPYHLPKRNTTPFAPSHLAPAYPESFTSPNTMKPTSLPNSNSMHPTCLLSNHHLTRHFLKTPPAADRNPQPLISHFLKHPAIHQSAPKSLPRPIHVPSALLCVLVCSVRMRPNTLPPPFGTLCRLASVLNTCASSLSRGPQSFVVWSIHR